MPKLSDASHEAEASIWDLVFGGKRELVWASQLFCTESQCFPATERILFVNCEVGSSTRGAFKVISAICLVGDQALAVTTFRVPGQENCWPPPSEIITKLLSALTAQLAAEGTAGFKPLLGGFLWHLVAML